jgi:exonuclease VII small subunit
MPRKVIREKMKKINNSQDYLNFLSVVIVSAPDKFRQFDFLRPEEQMNLTTAFEELHQGLRYLANTATVEKMQELRKILDDSLKAYQSGEAISGAHLLQDFEEMAFDTN